jgi:PAS domain S-box-containing protein
VKEKNISVEAGNEFSSAFEFAAIGMALVATSGQFLRVNDALCSIVGYTREELLELGFQKITHPDDLDADLEAFQEVLDVKRNSYQIEKRYFHKNENIVWVQLSVSVIRAADQKVKYFISQIQDVTIEKEATHALAERERQLSLIVDTTHDGIWDRKLNEDYEYLSTRFWQMLGYRAPDMRNHSNEWKKLIFPEDLELVQKNFDLHVQSGGEIPYYQEVRFRHKEGNTIWMIHRGKVVEWTEDGRALRAIGTHSDITELKAAQEALLYSSKMVALGEMAGGIAHEINNPLTIIKGHADRMRMMLEKENFEPTALATSVSQINLTVERISKIVAGLRNFSRDSSELYFESQLLIDVVSDALSFCHEKLKSHSIEIEVTGDRSLKVMCSRVQISQVLVNLINNAYYAVAELPVKWIRIELSRVGLHAKLSVTDSGSGISSKIRAKIMDPFFTTKPIGKGTGLGLSISRGIIENHSGKLSLDEKSANTKFDILIPLLID